MKKVYFDEDYYLWYDEETKLYYNDEMKNEIGKTIRQLIEEQFE